MIGFIKMEVLGPENQVQKKDLRLADPWVLSRGVL